MLDLFDEADEAREVHDLLTWWNRCEFMLLAMSHVIHGCTYYSHIFPSYSSARRPVCKNSALARIKEKRLELKALAANTLP